MITPAYLIFHTLKCVSSKVTHCNKGKAMFIHQPIVYQYIVTGKTSFKVNAVHYDTDPELYPEYIMENSNNSTKTPVYNA